VLSIGGPPSGPDPARPTLDDWSTPACTLGAVRGEGENRGAGDAGIDILRAIARRWPLVLTFTLVVPAVALVMSLSQPDEYSASASLLFRDPAFDQKLFGSSFLDDSDDPDREAATNLELVSLDAVAVRTARELGTSRQAVSSSVDVDSEGRSNLVSVTATDQDPRRAARIANTFAQEFIGFRQDADREKLRQAQALIQAQIDRLDPEERLGPEGSELRDRAQQLEVLASLQTGNAEVVQNATPPSSRSSPKPLRNTLLGLILGALLGAGLAFLLERLDRRFRSVKEVEEIADRPVLATIPRSRQLARGRLSPGPVEAEAFRLLRANLRYFNIGEEVKSVLITSASAGDGKSTVAWNLAAASGGGAKTLLIEADLRRPVLAERMGVPQHAGLSALLVGATTLQQAITSARSADVEGAAPSTSIDVLPAGHPPPNPQELLESDVMRQVIEECERRYDMVVIDTPPTSLVSDAIPLVNVVSGVIVVVHMGRSRRDAVRDLLDQLDRLGARTLGMVVNSTVRSAADYAYTYYASGDLQPTPRPAGEPVRLRTE
jgi:polysaccharide biosynthesis transport protein